MLLIGLSHDLSYFEEEAKDDPEAMLLIVCKKREGTFTRAKGQRIKARLLKESWRSDYFKPPAANHDKPQN
jgi:hypothetical protein